MFDYWSTLKKLIWFKGSPAGSFKGVKKVTIDFDSDGNLILLAKAKYIPETGTFTWTVGADGDTDTYTSTGPNLTFTAEQTAAYLEAGEITVQVEVDGMTSDTFTIDFSKYIVGIAICGIAIAS